MTIACRGPQVDTMIVQAIGLLDDLDKELNTYAMRVREWYGWHFPEMTRVVSDNIQYALVVKLCPPAASLLSTCSLLVSNSRVSNFRVGCPFPMW